MAHHETHRAWELMAMIRFCMLSTSKGNEIRSRPMAAFLRPDEGIIYFFTDVRRQKDDDIDLNPQVYLTFSHPLRQKYVSLVGRAEINSDRVKIKQLWSTAAKVWWETPDDPNIRLIKVVPLEADYWDSPSTWISNLRVAFGLLVGRHPYTGEHRKVVF